MGKNKKRQTLELKEAAKVNDSMCLYNNGDTPNLMSHLGFRVAYTIIAWMVLANGVSKDAFMVSACLFTMPIAMDCMKFTPTNRLRKYIVALELAISTMWLLVFLLGVFNVFTVKEFNGVLVMTNADSFIGVDIPMIPIRSIWRYMLSLVFVTAIDWLCQCMGLDSRGEKYDVR